MNFKYFFIFLFSLITFVGISQNKYDLHHYEGLASNLKINDIVLSDGISAYVATAKGLHFVSSVGVEARTIVPNKEITAISDVNSSAFYFGGNNEFTSSMNPGEFDVFGDKSVKVSCLKNHKEQLWIGTNDGIYVINKRRNKLSHHYTPNNSKLVSKQINFIHKDKFGILWIGSKNGVIRIEDDDWKMYEKSHSMEGIFENSEGLWLLSNKELWNVDNIDKANRWYKINLKKDLKKGIVNDLVVDSRGRLIIASDILVRFDPYKNKVEKYGSELGLVAKNCKAIAIDDEDRVWIGTGDAGLYTVGFKDHFKGEKKLAPIEFIMIAKSPSCYEGNDGSIKLMVKGGKKPYKFQWSTGDNDLKKLENLIEGNYWVTVTDAKDSVITKNISLVHPLPLTVKIDKIVKNILGSGSEVSFNIEGGTPGYRIEIDGVGYGNPAKNVGPGKHEAKIVDVFGCDAFVDFEVKGEKLMTNLDAEKIRVGQVVRINNLYFSADSTDINQKSKPVLDEIFLFLSENSNIIVEIGGHTNNIPSNEYCDKLSTERAKNVAEYMIKRGVSESRISYKGYGKRNPIGTNATAAGRKKNQRVEMKILSLGSN